MSPYYIILCISAYFGFLLLIAWYTSRKADNTSYFTGNKISPWYAVAFGMLSDSLSGVTFISVPGQVGTNHFSYLQLVIGYFFGYIVISQVLLPLYYRMNLTSIYSYLKQRFGEYSEKTGSFFFLLSRTLGAAARLYLSAGVIQLFVFDYFHVPFWISVTLLIALMLAYTYRGGIKTLVWTDVFQSFFLLLGVVLSIFAISGKLHLGIGDIFKTIKESSYSQVFFWDWKPASFFPKQFIAGMLTSIAMTGLDQNMMQKNLTCRSLADAQKNIRWFSLVMLIVNVFFLCLGALLFIYAEKIGFQVPVVNGKPQTDALFPALALNHLGPFAALVFIIGLIAATFSSADSVLTTLTTSFYIDILHADSNENTSEKRKTRLRKNIHLAFALILLICILLFKAFNNSAIIITVLTIAGYTYGPLLGMFSLGLFTKVKVKDKLVPLVCILSPITCYIFSIICEKYVGYTFSFELLFYNGLLSFIGLILIREKKIPKISSELSIIR